MRAEIMLPFPVNMLQNFTLTRSTQSKCLPGKKLLASGCIMTSLGTEAPYLCCRRKELKLHNHFLSYRRGWAKEQHSQAVALKTRHSPGFQARPPSDGAPEPPPGPVSHANGGSSIHLGGHSLCFCEESPSIAHPSGSSGPKIGKVD